MSPAATIAPASTTVVLTVGRSTVDADIASMDKIYDSEPVTPSANTESDGVMTWEFKPDGADPGAYTTAAPEDAGILQRAADRGGDGALRPH